MINKYEGAFKEALTALFNELLKDIKVVEVGGAIDVEVPLELQPLMGRISEDIHHPFKDKGKKPKPPMTH